MNNHMNKMMIAVLTLIFSAMGGFSALKLVAMPAGGDCRLQWHTVAGFAIPTCAGDCAGYANSMETCCLLNEGSSDSSVQTHKCICKNAACGSPGQWVDINNACSGVIKIDWATGQVSGTSSCVMDNPTSCPNGQTPAKKCKVNGTPPPNTAADVCTCQ